MFEYRMVNIDKIGNVNTTVWDTGLQGLQKWGKGNLKPGNWSVTQELLLMDYANTLSAEGWELFQVSDRFLGEKSELFGVFRRPLATGG